MENTNNQPNIPCFTIPALRTMSAELACDTPAPLFGNHVIVLCDTAMDSFRFPCRIDAMIISICTEGESTIVSSLHEYHLTKGSMFVCGPKNILQVKSASNFRSDILVVSPDLLRETHFNIKNMMPLFFEFSGHPCLPLPESDIRALHTLIAQIENEVHVPTETDFTVEIISGLTAACISKIGDILSRYLAQHPQPENTTYSRADEYFKQFMRLLGESYKEERSVSFYARRMCITPKYLTTLIKQLSGKSVSEWIDDFVILEAKTLLKYSHMSIQEVAYYLHFPNQSFFGSYFKRKTGLSPSQYKQQ